MFTYGKCIQEAKAKLPIRQTQKYMLINSNANNKSSYLVYSLYIHKKEIQDQ